MEQANVKSYGKSVLCYKRKTEGDLRQTEEEKTQTHREEGNKKM